MILSICRQTANSGVAAKREEKSANVANKDDNSQLMTSPVPSATTDSLAKTTDDFEPSTVVANIITAAAETVVPLTKSDASNPTTVMEPATKVSDDTKAEPGQESDEAAAAAAKAALRESAAKKLRAALLGAALEKAKGGDLDKGIR